VIALDWTCHPLVNVTCAQRSNQLAYMVNVVNCQQLALINSTIHYMFRMCACFCDRPKLQHI